MSVRVVQCADKDVVPLTEKQRRFVDEYLRCLNASMAARIVGYSQKNSDVASAKLMRKPHVRAAVWSVLDQEQRAREEKREQEQAAVDSEIMRRLRRRLSGR